MQFRIRWISGVDPAPLLEPSRLRGFELSVADRDDTSPCDISVVDARFFHSFDQFEAALSAEGTVPKLILVAGAEVELSLIRSGHAAPMDEFCAIGRTAEELIPRLLRLLGRVEAQPAPSSADSLTGVATRQSFLAQARAVLSTASPDRPVSVLMIDIDHFKKVNDELGHHVGDKVLRKVGDLLQRSARGVDCIARYGGEEFVILVRAAMDQAAELGEFLRAETEREEFENGTRITVSIGIDSTGEPTTEGKLVSGADTCLYRAKAGGRNRVVTADALHESEGGSEQDRDFLDFETRIHVIAERFGEELALRGKRMARRYREEAERDGLTGLYNRRYLDARLPREMENAVRHKRNLTLILLDLDHFGEVNRTYGFPGGDRVLKLLAGVLRTKTRAVDWVARYGGEEFCVVMPDTPLREGVEVAQRLRAAIKDESTHSVDGREIRTSASLGVVELDTARSNAREMAAFIQAASDRVREAKLGGRDQVRFGDG